MNDNRVTWRPEWIDLLTRLHGNGLSASIIAKRILETFGQEFSRNAVCGKLNRLGLLTSDTDRRQRQCDGAKRGWRERRQEKAANKKRPQRLPLANRSAIRTKDAGEPKTRPAPQPQPQRATAAPGGPTLIHANPVTLLARRRHQCAWPLNDGGPFLFCGAPKMQRQSLDEREYPYCPHHQWRSIGQDAARRKLMERIA